LALVLNLTASCDLSQLQSSILDNLPEGIREREPIRSTFRLKTHIIYDVVVVCQKSVLLSETVQKQSSMAFKWNHYLPFH